MDSEIIGNKVANNYKQDKKVLMKNATDL